jgi:hypothetical protein
MQNRHMIEDSITNIINQNPLVENISDCFEIENNSENIIALEEGAKQNPSNTEANVFSYTENFFENNPEEYEKIKNVFKSLISKFSQDALSHVNFCNLFATPSRLPDVVLKIIGLSESQVANSFYKDAHFFQKNAMHADSYYQVLLLLYYVALKKDDQLMRLYILTLIYVKIFNGRRIAYFPNGCIAEVASYILNNNFRSSHSFKKYRTPFHLVVEYLAPSLDQSYALRIRQTPFDEREGLVKILAQSWARMDQIFMGVQQHYYAAYSAGLKDVQMNATSSENDMLEQNDHSNSIVDKLADKINRTLLLKKYKLDPENQQAISRGIILPSSYILEVEKFLNDFTHDEDESLKSIYEAALKAFNIHDETGVCNIHIAMYTSKVTGTGTNPEITQFKQFVENVCKTIFGNVFITQVYNQQQKIRKLVITMILFRMKAALCKNTKYDAI